MYELAVKSRDIKLSKAYSRLLKQIDYTRGELTQRLGKEPTFTEICLYLEIDEAVASDAVNMASQMVSINSEDENMNNITLSERIGYDPLYDEKILINDGINTLEELEAQVIDYRYFQDLSQDQTADVLGISQAKVSRLENVSKKKLKRYIAA